MAHESDAGTGPGGEREDARPVREDPHGHAESARSLRHEASEQVGRGYDATQEAFVHQRRRESRHDEDDDVSPGSG